MQFSTVSISYCQGERGRFYQALPKLSTGIMHERKNLEFNFLEAQTRVLVFLFKCSNGDT